jgi:uncharacterized protein YkwD
MNKLVFFVICLCGVLAFVSCSDELPEQEQKIKINVDPKYHIELNRDTLLGLVNKARTSGCNCGTEKLLPVGKVEWNDKLEKAARLNSDYMFQFNTLTHIWSDGTDPGDRITSMGFQWKTYGENAAHGCNMTERSVIQGWLNSSGHCKNIMNGSFKFMGVARTGDYWTQVFTN